MDSIELKELKCMDKVGETYWYCGKEVCNLTHRYSPRGKATRSKDDPYK